MGNFYLKSNFKVSGDQETAVNEITSSIKRNNKDQVLLGVTGSGKTFTMANIIANLRRPAMIMVHNKTLAAQLYEEMRGFFPDNAVEYFVSYYDYYQPEAYIASSDIYIEKDSSINDRIDRLRHSATRALLERQDVIIISSVSAIYGLGSPEAYKENVITLRVGEHYKMIDLSRIMVDMQYKRENIQLLRGTFKVQGDCIDIFPAHYKEVAWRISFFGNEIDELSEFNPLTGEMVRKLSEVSIFPNSHHMISKSRLKKCVLAIEEEMIERVSSLHGMGKTVEANRLEKRTMFDIEMILETGTCKGIENYSRYFSARNPGEPPPTLFEYMQDNSILFMDESHVTVPQIGGMYNGDKARKTNLIEHGFRLPSALDNRPLKFEEWNNMRGQTVYVSATPGEYECDISKNNIVEQLIRPTGIVEPEYVIKPAKNQVDDIVDEIFNVIKNNYRVLITTLTKRMSEDLSEYLQELKMKVVYLHSEINALERVEIIHDLRAGKYDVLIGVNLLREGLDIPECGLVAIMDADKEGFLRSETSLIQTIGRAARNVDGRVILYADRITGSMQRALKETDRRRQKQQEFNRKNNITPRSVIRNLPKEAWSNNIKGMNKKVHIPVNMSKEEYIKKLEKEMWEHAAALDFEKAEELKEKVNVLKK